MFPHRFRRVWTSSEVSRVKGYGRGGRYEGFKIARKPSRDVRRSGRAAEIGGAGVMQRVGAAGGPGPIGFQGPPRSLKISPVNIQDESADPTQSEYIRSVFFLSVPYECLFLFEICELYVVKKPRDVTIYN